MLARVETSLREPLHELVQARRVTTHFQPIFSVRRRTMVGMEALSRGLDALGSLIPPVTLFRAAASAGLSGAVEDLCRESAVRSFARLPARPEEMLLFLNLDLAATADPEASAAELQSLVYAHGLTPRNIAVELLEARFDDVGLIGALAASLRRLGFLMALDDVGAGHSNLDRIPLFKPDVIKIDRSLITGVETDFYKQETVKSLVSLSRRIGALVVAEGIETEAEAVTALELGADLLQGYFLSRPHPAASFDTARIGAAGECVESLARAFKTRMVGEISDRKQAYRRFNGILTRLHGELANQPPDDFGAILAREVDADPKIECLYVLDDSGIQLTDTYCNAGMPRRQGGSMFKPAAKGTDHSLKEYFYVLVDVELPRYTTDPYVSLASGHLCRTISTCFRDAAGERRYVLCVDVRP